MRERWLLDSNPLIYLATGRHPGLEAWIGARDVAISAITRVEVLGYHQLSSPDEAALTAYLGAADELPLVPEVLDGAIRLRQRRRMSLGDALIAATALRHALALATHNARDFAWIDGLEVVDPLA